MPLGSVGYENAVNEKGERHVWLAPNVVDRLTSMRGPGESYSDVILRLARADRTSRPSPPRAGLRSRETPAEVVEAVVDGSATG